MAKDGIIQGRRPGAAVQIRRTDNVDSIRRSPLACFEEAIDTTLFSRPDTIFFLATDDSETKKILSTKYPSNIIFNPREARRDTTQGIIDAAAGLLIMSECPVIYGSYWSSYSEIAALYGNTQLIVLRR